MYLVQSILERLNLMKIPTFAEMKGIIESLETPTYVSKSRLTAMCILYLRNGNPHRRDL